MSDNEFVVCVDSDPMWRQSSCLPWENEIACKESTIMFDIMESVSQALKINQTHINIKGRIWTQLMLGEECDITLGLFVLHLGLVEFFQVSPSIITSQVAIFSAFQTKTSEITSVEVNIKVLCAIILCGLTLAILTYLMENFRHVTDNEQNHQKTFAESVWIYFSAVFQEGISTRSLNTPSLILHSTWFFALTILLSLLGGNMKAELTNAKNMEINGLKDLENRPDIQPIIASNSYIFRNLKESTDPTARTIFSRAEQKGGMIPYGKIVVHISDVIAGKSAILEDDLSFFNIAYVYYVSWFPDAKRPILHISDSLCDVHYAFYFNDYIPASVIESYRQKALSVAGTMQFTPRIRYFHRYSTNPETRPTAVAINVSVLIYVYFTGMFMAAIVLLMEMSIKFFQDTYNLPEMSLQ